MASEKCEGPAHPGKDGESRIGDQLGAIDQIHTLAESDGQHHRISADRVVDSIYDDWAVFDGLRVDVAYEIVDRALDHIITALRRDFRFASVSVTELELLLADVRRESALEIDRRADDLVEMSDIRDLAHRGFPTDADEGRRS